MLLGSCEKHYVVVWLQLRQEKMKTWSYKKCWRTLLIDYIGLIRRVHVVNQGFIQVKRECVLFPACFWQKCAFVYLFILLAKLVEVGNLGENTVNLPVLSDCEVDRAVRIADRNRAFRQLLNLRKFFRSWR